MLEPLEEKKLVDIQPLASEEKQPSSRTSAQSAKPARKKRAISEKQKEALRRGREALKASIKNRVEVTEKKKKLVRETSKRVRRKLKEKLSTVTEMDDIVGLDNPEALAETIVETFSDMLPQSQSDEIFPEQAPAVPPNQLMKEKFEMEANVSIDKPDVLGEDIITRLKNLEETVAQYSSWSAVDKNLNEARVGDGLIFL